LEDPELANVYARRRREQLKGFDEAGFKLVLDQREGKSS
jgi:hypothetical protein